MTIDFGSDGFDYTRTLCSAIEAYTEKATRHRDVFRYRGMQLRYAIERQLYIQGINSSSLFEAYLEAKGKTPPTLQEQSRRTALESDLAFFFGSSNDVSKAKVSKRPSNTYLMAQRAYGWFRSLFRRKPTPLGTQRCSKILIHIGNAKFATYLGPITGKLGKKSYSYLTCENPELAISLEKAGHPVVKCSGAAISLHSVFSSSALSPFVQMMHEADQILTALQTLRPKAVVVVEGNAPKDALTAEACRLLGVPCVCIQQGWSPYVHSGFRNMNYTEMLVWGPHFAELLAPFNPRQQFRVTGSHILQKHPGEESSRSVPSSRTFSFFLQAPCALLGIQAFDAFVELIEQTANRHPSIQFVVREHPGYRLSDQTREKLSLSGNIRFSVPAEERLADLIDQSELAISVFSTVLLEALAVNVVPLICSIGSMTRYSPDLASMNAAIEVHSIVEAEDVIEQAIRSPEIIASIRDHLPAAASGFFKKGDAIQEIADVLLAHTVH
jgi:hypothetical protein